MLIASNFILNKYVTSSQLQLQTHTKTHQLKRSHSVSNANAHEFYPWIHSFSNTPSGKDHGRAVRVPDVTPGGLPRTCDFSMVAGDFLEVYKDEEMRGNHLEK
jgi:hypothetical protein